LCERKDAGAVAVDISAAALAIARENGDAHGVSERIEWRISDCLAALKENAEKFDAIVSNPPYVSADALAGLQREVRDHEPLVALSPGADGLSVIRRLVLESPPFLKEKGHLLMEIGFDQSESVSELVNPSIWTLKDILPDLQGIPRIVVLQKN
jgi:release factor glutamine methyltransferase